jgi:alanyl-tRNA synthetase
MTALAPSVTADTHVSFPQGDVAGDALVLATVPVDGPPGTIGVICDRTPFHPVDHRWPDQPGDHGVLAVAGPDRQLLRATVVDCITGAVARDQGGLAVGTAIAARRGDPHWYWVVVHVVRVSTAEAEGSFPAGAVAQLTVDADRRASLSAAHTACHLSGLALNEALSGLWGKAGEHDSRGNPDFDGTALTSSTIDVSGFRDVYRLGRSLRKSGFSVPGLTQLVPSLGETLTKRVCEMAASGAKVRVVAADSQLRAPRTWHCELPDGPVSLACGGTHPASLADLASVRITARIAADGTQLLVVGVVKRNRVN